MKNLNDFEKFKFPKTVLNEKNVQKGSCMHNAEFI